MAVEVGDLGAADPGDGFAGTGVELRTPGTLRKGRDGRRDLGEAAAQQREFAVLGTDAGYRAKRAKVIPNRRSDRGIRQFRGRFMDLARTR